MAFILNFIPFTTYEKTSFTEYAGRMAFREFRETAPSS